MGMLDNSGDIILDSVLTDTGRFRLAKGDGSFKIARYAFSDDEINYADYDKTHASGSAYYDLDILQTPILEAFSNNGSSMKSKLVSIQRNNLLYLPILKLNRNAAVNAFHSSNAFLVAVDKTTEDTVAETAANGHTTGIMFGQKLDPASHILIEQGLDTLEIPSTLPLDSELVETQYIVEIDNRLGSLVSITDQKTATPSFIDDDNIASYYFTLGTSNKTFVDNQWPGKLTKSSSSDKILRGPRGTRFFFMIGVSVDLATSTFLFDQLGGTTTVESVSVQFIDTLVRVTGGTTAYSIDIPIRFIKAT
jgi:hypothetical protein